MNSPGARNWKSSLRYVVGLAGIAFAVHVMLPRVKELPDAVDRAETGSVWWIMAAAAISLAVYAGGAISLQGSLEQAIPIVPAAQTQLAIAFTGLMAPQGVGAFTTNLQFVQKQGVPPASAATAVGLDSVAGVIVHALSLIAALALVGRPLLGDIRLPPRWELQVGAAAVAIFVGLIIWSPLGRNKVIPAALAASRALKATLRHPVRFIQLFGGSALITFANALTLAFAMDAFGRGIPMGDVIAVYLAAAAIASLAPTPGGLGALEAALVAGLTAVGGVAGAAVGGVLVFRLLTFWLPILPGAWMLKSLRSRGLV